MKDIGANRTTSLKCKSRKINDLRNFEFQKVTTGCGAGRELVTNFVHELKSKPCIVLFLSSEIKGFVNMAMSIMVG